MRELRNGWLFPFRVAGNERLVGGPRGVIVNKTTGKALILGSGIPDERHVEMYEKGYCFDRYDLVITGVTRLEAALDTLMKLRISVVDVTCEHGKVWRIPRPTTREEVRARLERLPCVFGPIGLLLGWEELEQARGEGAFAFEVLEYKGVR